jgi:HlyD family secretion protein
MRTRLLVLLVGVIAVLGAVLAYLTWRTRPGLPEGLLQVNGRIEGDRVTVSSKFPGRVHRLLAREGDRVARNDVLVVLDDTQAGARVAQARAGLVQAEQRVRQADAAVAEADAAVTRTLVAVEQARARREQVAYAVASVEARIEGARTSLAVFRSEIAVTIATAEADVAQALAAIARADAIEEQAQHDAARYRWLAEHELVEPQRAEQAELAWKTARTEALSATSGLAQAHERLKDARLGPDRVRAREDDLRGLQAQRAQEQAAVAEADAGLEHARLATSQARAVLAQMRAALDHARAARDQAAAAVVEAASVRDDLTIVAPAAGVVTTRIIDIGEVVGAGAPLLEIIDLDRLYLKVFVPEIQIGKVRLGLPARVHVDAWPSEPYAATLRYIAARAEFTPKEVQTPDDRVKLVYAVKLYLDRNPEHRLTPGVPADAVIRWKETTPWQKPRW